MISGVKFLNPATPAGMENIMFRVHEMMGNFSKEVAMFETKDEASEYVQDNASQKTVEELGVDVANDNVEAYEIEYENQMSYFSIEDDGREVIDEEALTEMYDYMLDECYPEMFNMSASIILQRADPIQYNCGLNDFYDSIRDQYYCEEME